MNNLRLSCVALGNQFRTFYRYGTVDACSREWHALSDCMTRKTGQWQSAAGWHDGQEGPPSVATILRRAWRHVKGDTPATAVHGEKDEPAENVCHLSRGGAATDLAQAQGATVAAPCTAAVAPSTLAAGQKNGQMSAIHAGTVSERTSHATARGDEPRRTRVYRAGQLLSLAAKQADESMPHKYVQHLLYQQRYASHPVFLLRKHIVAQQAAVVQANDGRHGTIGNDADDDVAFVHVRRVPLSARDLSELVTAAPIARTVSSGTDTGVGTGTMQHDSATSYMYGAIPVLSTHGGPHVMTTPRPVPFPLPLPLPSFLTDDLVVETLDTQEGHAGRT